MLSAFICTPFCGVTVHFIAIPVSARAKCVIMFALPQLLTFLRCVWLYSPNAFMYCTVCVHLFIHVPLLLTQPCLTFLAGATVHRLLYMQVDETDVPVVHLPNMENASVSHEFKYPKPGQSYVFLVYVVKFWRILYSPHKHYRTQNAKPQPEW